MGHKVVRLPPYYCQYNLIELIWAKVKGEGEVAEKNNTFKMKDVHMLLKERSIGQHNTRRLAKVCQACRASAGRRLYKVRGAS